ncbi:hypothetical protein SAMN04488510_11431 [Fervidobacterium changbaicum]|uniref:Uncharacterized protein n=1 Tax=Fervidobacterium changbaicum TaxID=310769 RepID=A0ABX5QQZ2_9BACT|nr:hypothetical protein [Fervidobacterium changbaicum]QAV32668.1 hypothetical protein CBS1_02150 [Fervidobacterium changbaicum]SDH43374.1 hypothetical protein SAMN04488510_11431 [Fervidobacterium changbaicum]
MSLKISLGGDILHYLGSLGLLTALDEEKLTESDDLEIHCSGFSCVPLILWFYRKNSAYNSLSNMWNEAFKFFKGASEPSLDKIGKNLLLLYKIQRKIDTNFSNQKLREFVEKWIPDIEINESQKIKIHAYNLEKSQDDILFGNARGILMRAITYPIDFAPVDGYISSSWVFGIPEGDGIIYIDWYNNFEPRKATDFLLMATFARTSALIKLATSKAKATAVIPFKCSANNEFRSISNRFYLAGKELAQKLK